MTVETICFLHKGDADLLVVHYDASDHLHCYNPDTGQWRVLADLPPGAGHEYAAITGQSSGRASFRVMAGYFQASSQKSTLSEVGVGMAGA